MIFFSFFVKTPWILRIIKIKNLFLQNYSLACFSWTIDLAIILYKVFTDTCLLLYNPWPSCPHPAERRT